MLSMWFFVMGAMMGSVANAVIYRLPKNISWTKGRSICPKCKHELAFWDLIPLLSYLLLGGKCRYCKKPIGIRYFIVELMMAAGFTLILNYQLPIFNQFSLLRQGFAGQAILNVIIFCAILLVTGVIAVMDWETRLVSEKLVLAWGILIVILQILQYSNNTNIQNSILGLVVAVGLIGGIWAVSKGQAMGFGDVEIAVVLGWWLGWPKISTGLWAAFVIGAIVGLILIWKQKAGMKSQIAFGPFLVIGGWIGYMWGEKILHLILNYQF